jgi:uncharacterized membrane protein YphA (DoxX/SURF4 family)
MQGRRTTLAMTALLACLVLVTAGAVLHHGWSNYDQESPMNMTGTIQEFTYENPHGTMRLQTAEDTTWLVILAPTGRMESRGLTRDMLTVGGTATVLAYPHKTIADEARAERITIGEKTTELR